MRAIPIPLWLRGALALVLFSPAASAGEADVLSAEVQCNDERLCRFVVTLRHADEGWKHYADRWEVLSPEGELLATRVLRHPHVEEQPFTRALPGVKIPISVEKVRIRARDSVHGYGGEEIEIELPR
jgi:hypothetical protein